jgi:hypothetical protein
VHLGVLLGEPPGERDDLGDHEFDHAACVGERRVEDGDPVFDRGAHVDLVGADAECADRDQVGCGGEHPCRDVGLGPDAEQRDTGEPADQVVLVERAVDHVDLEAGRAERLGGIEVDLFQQQYPYGVAGHRSSLASP